MTDDLTPEQRRCWICGKNDEQVFPTIISEVDGLQWICRRHLWPGYIIIHAFTGMPITMIGTELDYQLGIFYHDR